MRSCSWSVPSRASLVGLVSFRSLTVRVRVEAQQPAHAILEQMRPLLLGGFAATTSFLAVLAAQLALAN
jgi:hypothetical protein